MKVIVAGGRDFDNYNLLEEKINEINIPITEIVSGGARGADHLGEIYASRHNIPLKFFPANWNQYGKSAGIIRNREMAEYADYLVAFWDNYSHGTKNMIDTMKLLNKKGTVIIYSMRGV